VLHVYRDDIHVGQLHFGAYLHDLLVHINGRIYFVDLAVTGSRFDRVLTSVVSRLKAFQ
jgi:hypothetical protein